VDPAHAYAAHLERTQASEHPDDTREGLDVWFEGALPAGRGRALDHGAGRGQGLLWLAERGFEAEGYEPDPALASALRRSGARVHDDADPIAFLDRVAGQYDLILCKDVLEHVAHDRIVDTAERLARALRPGGRLIVSVPHAVSFIGTYVRYGDFTHTIAFTEASLRYVLERAGLEHVAFHGPRFRFRPRPATIAYRALRRVWHGVLRGIYLLEHPSRAGSPSHFFPRLVATGDRARVAAHPDAGAGAPPSAALGAANRPAPSPGPARGGPVGGVA
jgi:SAM-dependent methyltransferase